MQSKETNDTEHGDVLYRWYQDQIKLVNAKLAQTDRRDPVRGRLYAHRRDLINRRDNIAALHVDVTPENYGGW